MENEKNPLLQNLVNDANADSQLLADGKMNFASAMEQMGITSVFDIIRQSKSTFTRRLSELNDDDGEAAYDNAMCYAVQIGRAYREHVISSGKTPNAVQQSGIRSLVEVGPSYANLFKENWEDFCKVGAMEAVDSPVAYLNRLYQLAITDIESQGQGVSPRILLDDRRPDLKELLINHQATYTPVPMLDIVNDVLTKAIETKHAGAGIGTSSVHELLRAKRHPFVFPYHFAHHQAALGFSGDKHMMLGEANYRISRTLPVQQNDDNEFGRVEHSAVEAQRLLSGLSPEQQEILIEPTLFSDFYLDRQDLKYGFLETVKHPQLASVLPWSPTRQLGVIVPNQTNVNPIEGQEDLTKLTSDDGNASVRVNFTFHEGASSFAQNLSMYQYYDGPLKPNSSNGLRDSPKHLSLTSEADTEFPETGNATTSFHTISSSSVSLGSEKTPRFDYLKQTYTVALNVAGYQLTPDQSAFFKSCYNVEISTPDNNALVHLDVFMSKTETSAEEVQALLAQKAYAPRVSANCPPGNAFSFAVTAYPLASHYGASYVNGVGGRDAGSLGYDEVDNSMGLIEQAIGDQTVWNITQTSLGRFDRLQRMIRLQRWMNIPFAELDTLLMAAIHSEREHNLRYELNTNTLRTLGVYRYFSERYSIEPEEFAGLLHHISPFAAGEATPLFDKVFNSPALFDTPLVLDQSELDIKATDAETQKTISQLCAGLKLQPTATSFFRLAEDTRTLANNGTLRRDLGTVSSMYRQARIAQLFDLSVEDSWTLIDLLGGEAYRERVASGTLRPCAEADTAQDTETPDILDILMHMDWAVTWLKETNQDVQDLSRQLGINQDESGLGSKLEAAVLARQGEVIAALTSVRDLTSLDLPDKDATGQPIDWIGSVLEACIDPSGAVNDPPLSFAETMDVWFKGQIDTALEALTLVGDTAADTELKARISSRLVEHLMKGHPLQHRIIHELLRSSAGVHSERVDMAVQWSGHSVPQLLIAMSKADATVQAVTILLATVRHTEVMHGLALAVPALRSFMTHPAWLNGDPSAAMPALTLANLYLLERYCQWVQTGGKPEDDLLAYFALANSEPHAGHPQQCAQALAGLIGWTTAEIELTTTTLEGQVAKSMQQVDWVRRLHNGARETGLSAAALLLTTRLDSEVEAAALKDSAAPDSDIDHWNAVGQAIMAARN